MWKAEAPSNIAMIKYMGKKFHPEESQEDQKNIPGNSSLSWTLDHLKSYVQIEENSGKEDLWQSHPSYPMSLSPVGRAKYLSFFQKIKTQYDIRNRFFIIRSGNNFPSDCGIASSASSFAALTSAAIQAFSTIKDKPPLELQAQAQLSRQGSGSSCRSFFPGWVSWEDKAVTQLSSSLGDLEHMVIIVSGEKKKVTSSEAHKQVESSLLYSGRNERANRRYHDFKIELLKPEPSWKQLFELGWADFWDMHALFETSTPSFGYMTGKSLDILQMTRQFWQAQQDGPLVTMDAGANVHLIWRSDQKQQAMYFKKHELSRYQVICSGGLT